MQGAIAWLLMESGMSSTERERPPVTSNAHARNHMVVEGPNNASVPNNQSDDRIEADTHGYGAGEPAVNAPVTYR